jgi:hypothetical protein
LWPIYYNGPHPVPLDEVGRKCRLLREQLSRIDSETIVLNQFLKRIWQWMNNGEVFYVGE